MTPTREPAARVGGARASAGRRRAQHSLDGILDAAIAILDAEGDQALTFRSLAAYLGGGVGSIYWYVSSRDELLERATDRVLAGVVATADQLPADRDPFEALRQLSTHLYRTLVAHPWMAAYLMRRPELQPNGLAIFDRLGRQTQRLPLTSAQRFLAVDTLISFINGHEAESRERVRDADAPEADGDQVLWRSLPPDEFPFFAEIWDDPTLTDDDQQFAAGLDLILSGLRQQVADAQ